ncbi:unnamed protein product, partial [Protopolystoma xenopodis]
MGRTCDEDSESPVVNQATTRLCKTIGRLARQFIQYNLPPLRVLPTQTEFDLLAARRRDKMTERWEQEDKVVAK